FVFVASMLLKIPIMGCVNDLLAIDRDHTEIRVVVEDGMNVDDVIDLLASKDLLYSAPFCKLVAQILDYSQDDVFPGGTYNLSSDMGLEGMLKEIISAGVKQSTVTLTFPEGYTVDQIIKKLSENNVASEEALYEALNGTALVEEFDFLSAIENRAERYSIFEGYLYPDTYEFYIGEDPESVFEKFLKNFAKRWTSEYDDNAMKLGMTVDEIVTLASILEKEAFDAQQMPLISSILFNRIHSTSFTFLNCDSTGTYLESIRPHVASDQLFAQLTDAYDTYVKTGLPVGAICNPGADAINAAMHPESSDYYYFLHDSSGKIYVARTGAEHEANIREHLNN
ncbi:MAG: endolytic transglycosylase MltG, partial [Clostridia bacterium]|nr:endolytic transglycosylase MltG [Clostridia bacterium]